MRIFHLGQHHEFYSAADIYDLCFALALATTSIVEFDVSAFCIDVGVLIRHAAKVLRSGVLGFARDRCSYVNHVDLRWNRVSLPNMADALPPQQCRLLGKYVTSRRGRHCTRLGGAKELDSNSCVFLRGSRPQDIYNGLASHMLVTSLLRH